MDTLRVVREPQELARTQDSLGEAAVSTASPMPAGGKQHLLRPQYGWIKELILRDGLRGSGSKLTCTGKFTMSRDFFELRCG